MNAKDIFQNTALHVAVCCGSLSCVKSLIKANADVFAVNRVGMTALEMSRRAYELMQKTDTEALMKFLNLSKTKFSFSDMDNITTPLIMNITHPDRTPMKEFFFLLIDAWHKFNYEVLEEHNPTKTEKDWQRRWAQEYKSVYEVLQQCVNDKIVSHCLLTLR